MMPRQHNLESAAFHALYRAWADRWADGRDVSEALVADAATEALNREDARAARLAGREPRLVAVGVMKDRFAHLVSIGRVGTRRRGDTRQSALWMNLGATPPAAATLRDGLEAFLADPLPAKDAVVSALRFIMRPELPNGTRALLEEAGRPAYSADQLTLLVAQVHREWRLRNEAAIAGSPLSGRGPVARSTRDNHTSALRKFLIWAGVNGHLPMVGSAQGTLEWHEAIVRWFGPESGFDEKTRRSYGASARTFVELLGEVYGLERPEPSELTWLNVEEVLDHLYATGRPRTIPRMAHIANAISNRAVRTATVREIPSLAPRQIDGGMALPATRGQTPRSWDGLDEYLGEQGLPFHHPLRAFLRYHGKWCTTEETDRTMPHRKHRQRMRSAQSEARRILGLRTWLGAACRVHNCTIRELTLSQAFGLEAEAIFDELMTWWAGRANDDDETEYRIESQGFQGFVIAGEQALKLIGAALLLDEKRTRPLEWLQELRENERAVRQGHEYLREKLTAIQEKVDGPLIKNLDEIIATTGPLWWMKVRDEAVSEVRRLQRATVDRTDSKETLERAHDCFALLLIIATMGRGREYTTLRLGRHALAFRSEGRTEWLKCDTKNRTERTGIADPRWLPADVRDFYLDRVRPTLIRLGNTRHKKHDWLLLVPGTGAPLGDPNEVTKGEGKELRVKRNDTLITRNLASFRHRLWCLTIELALAAGLTLPPRRLYGALKLHAIRANMAFAGALVHSIEIAAGLLGDTVATASRSYSALRTRHLKLRPQLLASGYTLPNELLDAVSAMTPQRDEPLRRAAADVQASDHFAERERELTRAYEDGSIDDEEYARRLARIRKARLLAA